MALSTALLLLVTALVSSPPRGSHPTRHALYKPVADTGSAALWSCADGSQPLLPLSRVNDDYCDCDDGSDEPGTSACAGKPTARFHCQNLGASSHTPPHHPRVWYMVHL